MAETVKTQKGRELNMGRDSGWLISADIIAVFLALIGQVVLTRALITKDYGFFVITLDLFATGFLIIDLGLPTILTRDGAKSVDHIWPAIIRIYRLQFLCMVPFLLLTIFIMLFTTGSWNQHLITVTLCLSVALAHIFSYAPRSGLRAAGYAWMEAWTKVIERFVTMSGYVMLYYLGNNSVEFYAAVFFIGALCGFLAALLFAYCSLKTTVNQTDLTALGACWRDNKSLILQALPFAITLGVLPYVIRIEKFIVAGSMGVDSAAILHVAQIAWLAGLVVPQAMRAALLPILGKYRNDPEKFDQMIERSLDICFGLLPIGLFAGALLISSLLPVAFPIQYTDGSLGASAVDLFMILLFGWCLTLLATPTYTALQAGKNPWLFTIFIGTVVIFAGIIGILLITNFAHSPTSGLYAAAIASTMSAAFLLIASIHLSGQWRKIKEKRTEFIVTIGLVTVSCYGFITGSLLALSGGVIFMFTPKGWKAMKSTDF